MRRLCTTIVSNAAGRRNEAERDLVPPLALVPRILELTQLGPPQCVCGVRSTTPLALRGSCGGP